MINSNIEEQLVKKFKELHLTSLMSAYTNNREDPNFLSQPLNKQLLTMLTQYEQMAKERRTERLRKNSGVPNLAYVASIFQGVNNRNIQSSIELIINSILQKQCRPIAISGATGVGKTYLSMFLVNQIIMNGKPALYTDYQNVIYSLIEHYNSRDVYTKKLKQYASNWLLVLDDAFLSDPVSKELEVLKDLLDSFSMLNNLHSILFSSQLEFSKWFEHFGQGYVSDAVIDRLTNGVINIDLKGNSKRDRKIDKIELITNGDKR